MIQQPLAYTRPVEQDTNRIAYRHSVSLGMCGENLTYVVPLKKLKKMDAKTNQQFLWHHVNDGERGFDFFRLCYRKYQYEGCIKDP